MKFRVEIILKIQELVKDGINIKNKITFQINKNLFFRQKIHFKVI